MQLVVSYANLGRDHYGTLYQAGNWFYLGPSQQSYLKVLGEAVHPRSVYDRYGKGGQSVTWLRANVAPPPGTERVARLQMLLETARLHLPRLPVAETLKQDPHRFEIPIQPNANELYGAFRVGNQDDRVTALDLAVHGDPGHRLLIRREAILPF